MGICDVMSINGMFIVVKISWLWNIVNDELFLVSDVIDDVESIIIRLMMSSSSVVLSSM